jgi:hypothetical protein
MVKLPQFVLLSLLVLVGCSGPSADTVTEVAAKQACRPDAGLDIQACQAVQTAGQPAAAAAAYQADTDPLLASYAACSGDADACGTLHNGALLRACERHFGAAAGCATDRSQQAAAERALLGACASDPGACAPVISARCAEHFPQAACVDLNQRLDQLAAQAPCGGDRATCIALASKSQQAHCAVALAGEPLSGVFCDLPLPGADTRSAPLDLNGCTYPLEPLNIPNCVASIRAQCDLRLGAPAVCNTYELMVDATLGLTIHCVEHPQFCAALAGRVVSFACHNSVGLTPDGKAFCEFLFPQPPTLPDIPTTPPPRGSALADSTALCLAYPALSTLCEDPRRLYEALNVDSADSSRLRAALYGGIE